MHNRFRRELLTSVAIIAGSFLISGIALYFLASDLQYQTQKIGFARAAVVSSYTTLDSFAVLKKGAAQAASYSQAMNKILVPQDRLLDFGKWLDGLARAHRIDESFSFGGEPAPPQENAPGYYIFSLGLSGKLGSIMDFMKDVEYKSPRFLTNLGSFDLSRSGDDYRVSINGRVSFK